MPRLPWEDVSLALPLVLDAAAAADGSAFLLTENRSPSVPYAVIESDPLTVQKHVRAKERRLHLYVTPEIAALCKAPDAELRWPSSCLPGMTQ
ncbi:MAG: hypothetical protein HP061_11890 [Christensenellaceae bacterium]|nr:hypothetical protein [Christensenellaceae bacterium]